MNYDQQILSVLDGYGGTLTGEVARRVGPLFGHNMRTHSAFIRGRLLALEEQGHVKRLDSSKPVCWVVANKPAHLRAA